MSSQSKENRWSRAESFPAHEARALRAQVTVLPSAVRTYVSDHGVSESLAMEHLLDLVEEAAVHGLVLTRNGEDVMRLALPRRIGQYHVMIDSRTTTLFAYSNHNGATTWVESRTNTDRAAAAAAQVKKEQKAAKRGRGKSKAKALCVTWNGEPAARPVPGVPLRVWRQLRQVDVALMVCNRAVADCVYFSTVPKEKRLMVMRAQLAFVLSSVSERQVTRRPDGFTVEHGPIAWHLRRDGRLVEQITVRTGCAQERFDKASAR
ncbi:hypothetical protein ACFXKF_36330 [Streptomyces scopuliridis]|uniref:hypothetical protein n=1 Tax=Streptomyces scopuliridis TaxID=452529 RepID=UPI00369E4DBF